MGVKVGIDCKMYRNTGTYGTPTWNEVTIVRDITLSITPKEAEANCRGSAFERTAIGLIGVQVDFDVLTDAAVDDYDVLRDAAIARTSMDFAIANGAIATTGTKYFRGDFYLTGFNPGEPLEESTKTPITAKLAYSSNTPGYTTVS